MYTGVKRGAAVLGGAVVGGALYKGSKRPRISSRIPGISAKQPAMNASNSAWTRCVDRRGRRARRPGQITRFQRKVLSITNMLKPTTTLFTDFTFQVSLANVNQTTGAKWNQPIGWFQMPLFDIYGGEVTGATDPTLVRLVSCGMSSLVTSSSNPAGLRACAYTSTTSSGQNQTAVPYTHRGLLEDADQLGFNFTEGKRLWVGKRSVNFQLRNPTDTGKKVIIYEVTSRTGVNKTWANPSTVSIGAGGLEGTSAPLVTGFDYTPLTCFAVGMQRKGTNMGDMYQYKSVGLTDSPVFNEYFKIKKFCSVYLPPGGTVEKSFNRPKGYVVDTQSVQDKLYTKRSTFLVMKVVPEVILIGAEAGGETGYNSIYPAYDTDRPGDATYPEQARLNPTTGGPLSNLCVIGSVSYRRKYCEFADDTNLGVYVPNGAAPYGSRYFVNSVKVQDPAQNMDVGGDVK